MDVIGHDHPRDGLCKLLLVHEGEKSRDDAGIGDVIEPTAALVTDDGELVCVMNHRYAADTEAWAVHATILVAAQQGRYRWPPRVDVGDLRGEVSTNGRYRPG